MLRSPQPRTQMCRWFLLFKAWSSQNSFSSFTCCQEFGFKKIMFLSSEFQSRSVRNTKKCSPLPFSLFVSGTTSNFIYFYFYFVASRSCDQMLQLWQRVWISKSLLASTLTVPVLHRLPHPHLLHPAMKVKTLTLILNQRAAAKGKVFFRLFSKKMGLGSVGFFFVCAFFLAIVTTLLVDYFV